MRDFMREVIRLIDTYPDAYEIPTFELGERFLPAYNPDPPPQSILTALPINYGIGENPNYMRDGQPNLWNDLITSTGINIPSRDQSRAVNESNPDATQAGTNRDPEVVAPNVTPHSPLIKTQHERLFEAVCDDVARIETVTIPDLAKAFARILKPEGFACSESSVRESLVDVRPTADGGRYDTLASINVALSFCMKRPTRKRKSTLQIASGHRQPTDPIR